MFMNGRRLQADRQARWAAAVLMLALLSAQAICLAHGLEHADGHFPYVEDCSVCIVADQGLDDLQYPAHVPGAVRSAEASSFAALPERVCRRFRRAVARGPPII